MKSDDIVVSRQGNLAVINHNKFEIKFSLSKGTWDYIDENGDTIIRNGSTQVTFADGSVIKTEDTGTREFMTELPKTDTFGDYHQLRFSHEAKGKGIRINTYLNCYSDHPAIHLTVGIENLKPEPVKLDSVTVIGVSANRGAVLLGATPADCHLFINMPPISTGVSKRLYDGFLLSETDAMHPSQDAVIHDTQSGKALVFGFLTTEKWWPRMQIGCQANGGKRSQTNAKKTTTPTVNPWALYHQCQQHCDSGDEIRSETVYINFTGGVKAAYEHYTASRAQKGGLTEAQPTDRHQAFAAWSFADTAEPLDSDAILTQADALAEHPLFQPNAPGGIPCIQLDTASGSQNPETVNQIQAKGFKTGIRFNPFSLPPDSEFVQKHPDYCIQQPAETRRGKRQPRKRTAQNRTKPATIHLPDTGKEVALLDVSHPQIQSRIREQIKHIVSRCGYSLINVDFTAYTIGLTNDSQNLHWHNDRLTAVQLYRFAVELIKDTINEILLANLPTQQNVALVGYNAIADLCIGRIAVNAPLLNAPFSAGGTSSRASDQWHHQRGTKHRLSRYAAYLREHNVLWNHLFGELAVDEPRPINEAIAEMTAAAFSGGSVLCADPITTLKPLRAAYLAKIFPLLNEAATPIGIYDEPFPKIWSLPVSTPRETWHLAAVFNWNDHEDDVYFQLDTLGVPEAEGFLVHDFWMRQYLGKVSQGVNLLNIPPRSAKLLCFREEQDVPQLLATDIHYTQGSAEILSAGWDTHTQSYLLVCKPLRHAEGTCFIHVPDDYLPISVAAYGSDYKYNWDKPIYQLTFTETQPDQLVHASIHFAKTSGGTS